MFVSRERKEERDARQLPTLRERDDLCAGKRSGLRGHVLYVRTSMRLIESA